MKNIRKQLTGLLTIPVFLAAVSCTEVVTIDDSVDQRVDAVIDGYIEELSTAENGWIASVSTDEGIYRFWMDFSNNNAVTMYTDNLHYPEYRTKPQTSTYNIRSLLLPTLSFDTYSYIHIINDPNDSISFGSDNQGLNTDFEFEIDDYKDGVFTLTGRINRTAATLTRASYDDKIAVQSGGLMSVLTETASYRKGQYCCIEIGGVTISVSFRPRSVILAYLDAEGVARQVVLPTTTQLDRDVRLNEPAEIGGVDITGFDWNEANGTYTALTSAGEVAVTVQDEAVVPLYKMLGGGKVYTTMFTNYEMYASEGMTEEQIGAIMNENAAFYYYAMAEYYLYDSFSVSLGYIAFNFYLTTTNRPRLRLTFVVSSAQGIASVSYSYALVPNDSMQQLTVGSSVTFVDESSELVYNYGVKPFVDYLKSRTFQVEWSKKEYESETMGQLRLIQNGTENDAIFYGALY